MRIPGGVTFYPQFVARPDGTLGAFLHTDREDLLFLEITLYVQDVSRQALTWGTEIPTVPETEAFTGVLALGDIPVDERFRSRLRVYDFDPALGRSASAAYRIYAVDPAIASPMNDNRRPKPPDQFVAAGELTFRVAASGAEHHAHPGYAELALDGIAGIDAHLRVRIELEPITPGLRFWAFVSVTNNETQHVTTITPQ